MIHRSPYPPITLTGESITERVLRGLGPDPNRVVLIDGPSGREMTAGALEEGIRRLADTGGRRRGYRSDTRGAEETRLLVSTQRLTSRRTCVRIPPASM